MQNAVNINDLFEQSVLFPDCSAQERLANLVGIDDQKLRLSKILGLLVNPTGLESWANKFHPNSNGLIKKVLRRPPLVVLSGDVGSGKTELAETIGDAVAREQNIDITLLPLSLSSRGQGRVGEMTQLLSSAFDYLLTEASKLKSSIGKASRGGMILLVDEADALAQSRESAQMHHEDRAGVNAFIRGIDRIASDHVPAAVIMCTNRIGSLDPAVKRRAADILTFQRPNDIQRKAILESSFNGLNFSPSEIEEIVQATGAAKNGDYGYTFSDLIQRFIPYVVLDAYPAKPVTPNRALEIAQQLEPTPPFREAQ